MTVPKGWLEWFNTKAGNTISMFLAGAFVVLVATGAIQLPWSKNKQEFTMDKDAIRELMKAELKEQLTPVVETQKEQAKKLENLGLELANLKGRMQLAGIGSMGAGRGARN